MDACTLHRVNYFAINIGHAGEGKRITKIFAINDAEAQHSRKFLTQLVKGVLEDYGIQEDHVLCIVTDNAFNTAVLLNLFRFRSPLPSIAAFPFTLL